jgi:hypothetical protein
MKMSKLADILCDATRKTVKFEAVFTRQSCNRQFRYRGQFLNSPLGANFDPTGEVDNK